MRPPALTLAIAIALAPVSTAHAFCGFYVAKADTQLFNQASKVVLVRHDDKTVLTMANDFRGDPKEFAIVIPVPTFIERGQINVTENALLEHLDAYTAPRLVEYFDGDPCAPRFPPIMPMAEQAMDRGAAGGADAAALGVTVEAEYTVGEYDIVILSAEESTGLEAWLQQNGYRIPAGAADVLGSYLAQGMRFFVAKVNLDEQAKLGFTYLRPIQVAYESPKFMLPIRLGMVNADGPQELFVFALTRKGRVETTNYRTVRLPSDVAVPLYVKEEFGPFYRAMFEQQTRKEDGRAVFLEYAWNMSWCDPCAADPLTREQLRELGVFWLDDDERADARRPAPGAVDAYVTRLHVRYDADNFPDDLRFQETGDTTNFQGRYILRHPWSGKADCEAAASYWRQVRDRQEAQAKSLATLTGWDIANIRARIDFVDVDASPEAKPTRRWWEQLWR